MSSYTKSDRRSAPSSNNLFFLLHNCYLKATSRNWRFLRETIRTNQICMACDDTIDFLAGEKAGQPVSRVLDVFQ